MQDLINAHVIEAHFFNSCHVLIAQKGFPPTPHALFELQRNYSPRVRWSRGGCHGRGLCQGVADGDESAPAVAAAGFDN